MIHKVAGRVVLDHKDYRQFRFTGLTETLYSLFNFDNGKHSLQGMRMMNIKFQRNAYSQDYPNAANQRNGTP